MKKAGWGLMMLLFLSASFSRAEDGITEKEILLGMSSSQAGPLSEIGRSIKDGATVYFNKVNAAGGVQGRKIKLLVSDDGYQPQKAIENTRQFIEEEKVFALYGYLGSPTSVAVMRIFKKAEVPYLAPVTGIESLRTPVDKYIFNLRVSLADETEVMVERLVQDLQIKKIGVFIQDDALGEAGRAGVIRALRKRNMSLAGDGRYARNTVDVDGALEALIKANPEAVIMLAAPASSSVLLKKAKARRFTPRFLSFASGPSALIHEAGSAADGVIMTQTVPNPKDSALPVVKEYLSDIKAAGLAPDLVSLETYLSAKVVVEAMKRTAPLTREGLLSTLENFKMDAGGVEISFSPTDHQGIHQIFLTRIENGKLVSIQNLK
ncbi:MAG TPA: ABC transporter substrate-binding protein [Candidatus Manganitrophaceae bacterium]|nr:ABC transporter substrate-binding protein [Candidatus Manganitrophaceae bacterium]